MYFIVTVSYRGALNSFLTVTTSPKPADTLEAVAKMVHDFLQHLKFSEKRNNSFKKYFTG